MKGVPFFFLCIIIITFGPRNKCIVNNKGTSYIISFQACNKYSNLTLEEKPTLFLEFHSSEVGLDDQTKVVSDIAHDNGGSDFQFARQVTLDESQLFQFSIERNISYF